MRRRLLIVLLLLALSEPVLAGVDTAPGAPALADDETAPTGEIPAEPRHYRMLRFQEDYSYLANPAQRSDWFDPIKYLPLRTSAPSWYLTLGGEIRERFEGAHNPDFGIDADHDAFWLQRLTLLADLHLGDRVRVFAEGISGLVEGESQPAPPVQDDPADLQFAFVDVVPYRDEGSRLTVRGGRFGMSLGSGRLVATRAAPNIPFRFDGLEVIYGAPRWHGIGFLTKPAKDSGGFDWEDPTTAFWGLYLTGWFEASHDNGLDVYYLGIRRAHGAYATASGDEHRHSFGARGFGAARQWDWDAEALVQVGDIGNDSILAWTASLHAGHTWDVVWQPRLGLKFDVASGDHDADDGRLGTFDALFFKSGYFNDASLIRPQNVVDVHPTLGLQLTPSIAVDTGVDLFWRYARSDAVYAVPGFVGIPADPDASSYVGTAVDVNLEWHVDRHVVVQASYVHFFVADYVHDAGGGAVDYGSTTISFLF